MTFNYVRNTEILMKFTVEFLWGSLGNRKKRNDCLFNVNTPNKKTKQTGHMPTTVTALAQHKAASDETARML